MGRRNIFNMLAANCDFAKEIKRIQTLLAKKAFYLQDLESPNSFSTYSVVSYCDAYCFGSWKQRNRCIDRRDFCNSLGISRIIAKTDPTLDELIQYLEYVINIWILCKNHYEKYHDHFINSLDSGFWMIDKNIRSIISQFNYEITYLAGEEKAIIIEKNPAATAVAEIVESELVMQVIEYNHHTMKGDLEGKRKILRALSNKFDAKKCDIPADLAGDVSFLMNNLNIRHNNTERGSKDYIEFVANMPSEELEAWYDETYQTVLLALLEADHKERKSKIKDLKTQFKNT